jgi:hypothetical protein
VPTPAIVAPIEFSLPRELYVRLGGHVDEVTSIAEVLRSLREPARVDPWLVDNRWPFEPAERR